MFYCLFQALTMIHPSDGGNDAMKDLPLKVLQTLIVQTNIPCHSLSSVASTPNHAVWNN